jgi:phenylalanyl-tRNA synthetase beta chain
MPTISLIRSHLFDAIGQSYSDEQFDELCFEFGVEVDDVVTETVDFTVDNSSAEHVVYKIDIPANRYDLLCMEGFARAIRIFLGKEPTPNFKCVDIGNGAQTMVCHSSTSVIRPFVSCAILRGVKFDAKRYKSFIDLQDKLHQNICRRRTYVAIGTHDLDTVKGPFRYQALPPEQINFVPLTETTKSFSGKALIDEYRTNPAFKHLKPYTDIIYDSTLYPIIYDSNNTVLSLPPIINSNHSKISLNTTNVFIECTGTDITKTNIVLDTIVTMFSEYCKDPFVVEGVNIEYEGSKERNCRTPLLTSRTCDAKVKEVNGTIGINITPDEMCRMCEKMQLGPAEYISNDGGSDSDGLIRATVPPTRSDVLHAVDIIEDIAIAYGYNNIKHEVAHTNTVGEPLPINQFTDLLRAEIGRAGYVEMLTHGLCSTAENFTHLRHPIGPAVSLSNPANIEYEVARTTLIPGALKTLAFNKNISHKDGVKLFEISDVVIPCDNEIGAKNLRKLCALHSGHSSAFEIIHGLMDRIMQCSQIKGNDGYARMSLSKTMMEEIKRVARDEMYYSVRHGTDPLYFDGMSGDIVLHKDNADTVIGSFGVVHPDVLKNFEIIYPCTVLELDLEAIM